MAKSPFSPQQKKHIQQAKFLLRTLWKQSGLKQKTVLEELAEAGLNIKKNTLSSWFSETDLKRPDGHFLLPLIEIISPQRSSQEIQQTYQEVSRLLGYQQGPESSETVLNQISHYLNARMTTRLNQQYQAMETSLSPLVDLLENLQTHIFEYDKGYPVIRIDADNKTLLRQIAGKKKAQYENYRVRQGYEIPLTQLPSMELITEITNLLHESTRILRVYVERCLLRHEPLGLSLPAFEELLDYIWEIVNRLLFNPLTQDSPALKKALLTVVTAAWGIKYLVQSQQGTPSSLVAFQNLLELKGMQSKAEIRCSVAVYGGALARMLLNSAKETGHAEERKKALRLFNEAKTMLMAHHASLEMERDVYYYKKEIANLCYDMASLLLWHQHELPDFQTQFQTLMQQAYTYYQSVLETVNLFQSGISEARAAHIRAFYTLTSCWLNAPEVAIPHINMLNAGQQFNEVFWLVQMAKAIAFGILLLRTSDSTQAKAYRQAAQDCLARARLVPGMQGETERELNQDYVLQTLFAAHQEHTPLFVSS